MNKARINQIVSFIKERYGKNIDSHPTTTSKAFDVLIYCILSQRTREENTQIASESLLRVANTPEKIIKISVKRLQELIRKAGFYRNKSKNIKKLCKILIEKYNGRVPKTREELMSLPGVGFKTSAIVLSYGLGKPIIAVDTHVFRVSKRLGLAHEEADVEEVRESLQKIIPKKKWYLINLGFVNFGREICKPLNPLCIKDSNNCQFSSFCKAYRIKKFYIKPFGTFETF